MSVNGWKEVKLGEVIQFDPKESLKKKQIAKKIAMDKLLPFSKNIDDYEISE